MSIDLRIISRHGERTISTPMRGVRLGRDVSPSDDMDAICLVEDVVSKHHADIVFENGPQGSWYYLRPRNPRNPVLLDGHEVTDAAFLKQHSRVQLGRTGPIVEVAAILGRRRFPVALQANHPLQRWVAPVSVALMVAVILTGVFLCG